jgi:hypothetical protein
LAEPLTGDDPREVGAYRLRTRLGSGSMGRVYLALTPGGRQVAVKMVRAEFGDDEQFRARFRQEVSAAQRVHGLFTAQVLEADPDAPQPWLATSFVPGLSLRQAVTRFGPLPPDTVFLLLAGIAEALQAIHAVGIVHRDLKPSNVILAADGPRVIDFGIARAAAAPALTRSGSWVGSPWFMAPEQARSGPATPAADVFSLGSLAVYAAAGHPPFGTDGEVAVLSRVLNESPDLRGCPPAMRPLIKRCLAKDPARRPQPGQIISACRDRATSRGLTFGRSWLPAPVSAAAADDAAPPAWPVMPETGDAAEGTGPDSTSPSQDHGPGPRLPEPPPAPRGPRMGSRLPRQKARTVVAAVTGTAVLLLAAGGVAVLANEGGLNGQRSQQAPAAAGRVSPGLGTGAAGTSSPRPAAAASPSSGRGPAASTTARPRRARPTAGSPAPSAASPSAPGPTAGVIPTGRAAFGGTWAGTVSQPGSIVTRWTLQVTIPVSASQGSYDSPSTACTGSVSVQSSSGSALTAVAATSSLLNPDCALLAHLTLTLTGPDQLRMTWEPAGLQDKLGTAVLTHS